MAAIVGLYRDKLRVIECNAIYISQHDYYISTDLVGLFNLHKGSQWLSGLMCLALKQLAPLRWGSNPMRDSCQLLTEDCWFTPRNNVFLQLWKLTAIYNQYITVENNNSTNLT